MASEQKKNPPNNEDSRNLEVAGNLPERNPTEVHISAQESPVGAHQSIQVGK
jgi:hypothetical protein